MPLQFTLRADGPTDVMLMPILEWVLRRLLPSVEIDAQFANPKHLPRTVAKGILDSIEQAIENFPCDLLFIHRDAEGADPALRHAEIGEAVARLGLLSMPNYIPVVPVRMSEAWLLISESAIRFASGNPNGKIKLNIPKIANLESIPDPKSLICELLRTACGLKGRRLKSFRPLDSIPLIAEYIDDFSPLLKLEAFKILYEAIAHYCSSYESQKRYTSE